MGAAFYFGSFPFPLLLGCYGLSGVQHTLSYDTLYFCRSKVTEPVDRGVGAKGTFLFSSCFHSIRKKDGTPILCLIPWSII